ncbi:MAG: DinB family protein [Chloroflexales bacterium]|nr:DinB family protein [Chloroflexales bacterium]
MAATIERERFTSMLFAMLTETFEQVQGIYLDKGTSLFETLAPITAEQASRPVSHTCASIAAQVEHVRFYIDVLGSYIRNEAVGKVDWQASWQRQTVSAEEWDTLRAQLREAYDRTLTLLKGIEAWDGEDEIDGAMSIVVHTAYHLGEIRQALCTIK